MHCTVPWPVEKTSALTLGAARSSFRVHSNLGLTNGDTMNSTSNIVNDEHLADSFAAAIADALHMDRDAVAASVTRVNPTDHVYQQSLKRKLQGPARSNQIVEVLYVVDCHSQGHGISGDCTETRKKVKNLSYANIQNILAMVNRARHLTRMNCHNRARGPDRDIWKLLRAGRSSIKNH